MHFTEEEAVILKSAIENIDDTNLLKQNLKRKLYSVYDNKTLADTVVRGKNAPNIRTLIEAIDRQRQAILHSYQSPHGGEVRDRRVEPFAFTTNYVQVWCYDPEAGACKLFKTSRIGSSGAYRRGLGTRGGAPRRVHRRLPHARWRTATGCGCELGLLALQPVSARSTRWPNATSRPLGRGEPLAARHPGRRVSPAWDASPSGCWTTCRIVDSPELTAYIRDYIAANKLL